MLAATVAAIRASTSIEWWRYALRTTGGAGVVAVEHRLAAVLAQRRAEHAGDVLGAQWRSGRQSPCVRQRAHRPALADLGYSTASQHRHS